MFSNSVKKPSLVTGVHFPVFCGAFPAELRPAPSHWGSTKLDTACVLSLSCLTSVSFPLDDDLKKLRHVLKCELLYIRDAKEVEE